MFKAFSRSSEELFSHLAALGANLEQAVQHFDDMVTNWPERESRYQVIQQAEHEGDRLLRDLQEYLKDTFFVPGDRESIYALTNELDDVCDWALKIANYLLLYRVDEPPPAFVAMVRILLDCCKHLDQALIILQDRSQRERVNDLCLRVIKLEDDADQVYRQGLERLFDNPTDLLDLLKWKDILDWTDDAVDHANHVAYRLMGLNGDLH